MEIAVIVLAFFGLSGIMGRFPLWAVSSVGRAPHF